jgi:hypothetical protein
MVEDCFLAVELSKAILRRVMRRVQDLSSEFKVCNEAEELATRNQTRLYTLPSLTGTCENLHLKGDIITRPSWLETCS